MNTSQSIDVSIIIPVKDEEEYLPACLDAIFFQITKRHIEIIVVDNGSTDSSQKIAREKGARVIEESTLGVGVARRAGTQIANGEYILHIDADTRLPKEYIESALLRFSKDSSLVCLGGQMYWYDASRITNIVRRALYVCLTPIVRIISRGALGPMGNNMMFPRAVYEKCKGFDIALKFGEDADLTRQLRKFGTVRLDLSLSCNTSSRRFRLNKDFFLYCINVFCICLGFKPLMNNLPSFSRSTISRHIIDK